MIIIIMNILIIHNSIFFFKSNIKLDLSIAMIIRKGKLTLRIAEC